MRHIGKKGQYIAIKHIIDCQHFFDGVGHEPALTGGLRLTYYSVDIVHRRPNKKHTHYLISVYYILPAA